MPHQLAQQNIYSQAPQTPLSYTNYLHKPRSNLQNLGLSHGNHNLQIGGTTGTGTISGPSTSIKKDDIISQIGKNLERSPLIKIHDIKQKTQQSQSARGKIGANAEISWNDYDKILSGHHQAKSEMKISGNPNQNLSQKMALVVKAGLNSLSAQGENKNQPQNRNQNQHKTTTAAPAAAAPAAPTNLIFSKPKKPSNPYRQELS